MTSGIEVTADHPRPLPVIPRPRHGEALAFYLRRLADANHLRPSYLRKYLCAPPGYTGSVRVQRLAVLTNRTVDALTRTFPTLQVVPRERNVGGARAPRRRARVELFEAIRREARTNHSIRSLCTMFSVRSETVIRALAHVDPKVIQQPQRSPILVPFRPIIDEMLDSQSSVTIWRIWEHLVDQHGAEVSYATVRDYVTRRRRLMA